jgi:dolichol-phosphate mannosyltransferase
MNIKKISIVVPVFNSSQILEYLLDAVECEREKNNWDLELVLIDDGSQDSSYEKIKELSDKYRYIKGVKLSRNFGHQIAVKTGLSMCKGEFIAIIDDDLQDPPELLPIFFRKLEEGYDVVYGVRTERKESFLKRLSYSVFYRVLKKVSHTNIPLDSGDFCVMRKKVVESMLSLQEKNPFLRGIRAWVGFRQTGLTYERKPRFKGESGYTLIKLIQIAKDGIFSFSSFPIKLITYLGLCGLLFAMFYSAYTVYEYFFVGIPVKGFASLVILISFFSSLIIICLGIIGEYIVRIYDETKNRPYSIVEDCTFNEG